MLSARQQKVASVLKGTVGDHVSRYLCIIMSYGEADRWKCILFLYKTDNTLNCHMISWIILRKISMFFNTYSNPDQHTDENNYIMILTIYCESTIVIEIICNSVREKGNIIQLHITACYLLNKLMQSCLFFSFSYLVLNTDGYYNHSLEFGKFLVHIYIYYCSLPPLVKLIGLRKGSSCAIQSESDVSRNQISGCGA